MIYAQVLLIALRKGCAFACGKEGSVGCSTWANAPSAVRELWVEGKVTSMKIFVRYARLHRQLSLAALGRNESLRWVPAAVLPRPEWQGLPRI